MPELSSDNLKSSTPTDDSVGVESLTVEQAIANLQGEDDGLRYYAAWWLGKFRVREPEAIAALTLALEDEDNRTESGGYPLRRNAARALGKLGNCQVVPALVHCLDCADFYVREAAAQSLGMLGDRIAIPGLMKLLAGGLEAAVRASGSPHLIQPYDAVIEALGALGATEAIALIEPFLNHSVEAVKYAAARAMYQLTQNPIYANLLIAALKDERLQLRRTVLADLGAIGYLNAAEAIAQTLAENSLKLISLKGLLEHQINQTTPPSLSEGAIRVMTLMDALL